MSFFLGVGSVVLLVALVVLSPGAVVTSVVSGDASTLLAVALLSLLTLGVGGVAFMLSLQAGYAHGAGATDGWADVLAMWGWLLSAGTVGLWIFGFVAALFSPLAAWLGLALGLLASGGSVFGGLEIAHRLWGRNAPAQA